MSSKRLSKQEMREDEFRDVLAEVYFGTLGYITEKWRAFATGFVVVLLMLAGAFYLWQNQQSKAEHNSFLLGQLMDAYNAPVEATPKGGPSQLSYPSEAQRAQAVDARLSAYSQAAGAGSPMAVYYKSLIQARAGNLSEATTTVSALIKDAELAPVALSLRASLYEGQSQWDKAEADYKALAGLTTPTWTPADGLLALGSYYERRGQKDKALEALGQVEKAVGKDASDDPLVKSAKAKIDEMKGAA
jgi:tetratricopeptide (TPR) repeat protein